MQQQLARRSQDVTRQYSAPASFVQVPDPDPYGSCKFPIQIRMEELSPTGIFLEQLTLCTCLLILRANAKQLFFGAVQLRAQMDCTVLCLRSRECARRTVLRELLALPVPGQHCLELSARISSAHQLLNINISRTR